MAAFGMITEQGDLGLGWNPLNKQDNKVVNEAYAKEQKEKDNQKNTQVINDATNHKN